MRIHVQVDCAGPEPRLNRSLGERLGMSYSVGGSKRTKAAIDRQYLICARVKKLGYASERRIRLYGEDLQLVSNPVADDDGYSVLALTIRTGTLRHLRIPLPFVSMLERDLERDEALRVG
jgi:hypothetical protein